MASSEQIDEEQNGKKGQELSSEPASEKSVAGKRAVDRATVIKFVGLIAVLVIMAIVVVVMWPYIADVFTEGGVDRLVERVRNAGVGGVFILLGMQFLQIIVAFIPGEVVQLAAGLMYGPWLGAAIILIGCVISSAIIYKLVHALGAPFVQSMVSTEHLEKFRSFEKSGKLDVVVFVLFLIPAMPKDVFTYLVPLTDMKMGRFLTLATIGRIPGVLASTYVAHGLSQGDMIGPIVNVVVVAVIALIAVVFRDRIMSAFDKKDR
jgi:uncharacterized membrane protein YdjX (TVP38/TMEM64 family)